MSEHTPPDLALIVAALDDDDPTRRTALAHAADCADCARVLHDGEAMLALIDAHAKEVPIDPRLKARILETIARVPQHQRGIRWEHITLVLGGLLSAWLAWFDGQARTGLYPARGLYCVSWEVLGASLPLVGAGVWAARQRLKLSALRVALLAQAGAIVGQLWLRYRCPTHDAGLHVLVYHVTGVVLIAIAGLIAEQRPWRRLV
jgi:hypothetical protein